MSTLQTGVWEEQSDREDGDGAKEGGGEGAAGNAPVHAVVGVLLLFMGALMVSRGKRTSTA